MCHDTVVGAGLWVGRVQGRCREAVLKTGVQLVGAAFCWADRPCHGVPTDHTAHINNTIISTKLVTACHR